MTRIRRERKSTITTGRDVFLCTQTASVSATGNYPPDIYRYSIFYIDCVKNKQAKVSRTKSAVTMQRDIIDARILQFFFFFFALRNTRACFWASDRRSYSRAGRDPCRTRPGRVSDRSLAHCQELSLTTAALYDLTIGNFREPLRKLGYMLPRCASRPPPEAS